MECTVLAGADGATKTDGLLETDSGEILKRTAALTTHVQIMRFCSHTGVDDSLLCVRCKLQLISFCCASVQFKANETAY